MPISYEKIKARKAIDPEYAKKQRDYAKSYRERNIEKERERQRLIKEKKRTNDKETNNAYMREWNAKNKERLNKERRERRLNDPEYSAKIKAMDVKRYWKDPRKHKDERLKRTYGISLEDYSKMLKEQNECCKICGIHKDDAGVKGLAVDHCHVKGHIRGLLCSKCNTGLGQFKDDIALLEKAIKYLNN